MRQLRRLPASRCTKAGDTFLPDPHAAAEGFQAEFDGRPLQLGRSDCRDHVQALLALLLGGEG